MPCSRTKPFDGPTPWRILQRASRPAVGLRRWTLFFFGALNAFALTSPAAAQNRVISLNPGQNLDWFNAQNWNPATVPTAGDDVVISQSGSAAISPQLSTGRTGSAGTLTLGQANASGTLTISGGTFNNVPLPAGLD